MPSFAIILTTHKRPGPVIRAVESVRAQTCDNWRLVVVNDSPEEDYAELEALIRGQERVSYLKNGENLGKNTSVNRAFDLLHSEGFQGYVVFLDDDDWLAPACLSDFANAIGSASDPAWLVSQRVHTDGTSFTKNRTGQNLIHYYRDCLILKRFSGDATHCIHFKEASMCHFPDTIKNAEEWFFFSQLARHTPSFTYLPSIGTYSEGYLDAGLTRAHLSRREKIALFMQVCKELLRARIWNAYTALYMILRLGKIFVTP